MVYFILDPTDKGKNTALYECEIYWHEEYNSRFNPETDNPNKKYRLNIDLHCHFYDMNLLREYRRRMSEWSNEKFEELIRDMESITDFRGWLWERTSINRELDPYSCNSPASSAAYDKVEKHCADAIYAFAKKYGYEVKID